MSNIYTKVSSKCIDSSISFCNEARAQTRNGAYSRVCEYRDQRATKLQNQRRWVYQRVLFFLSMIVILLFPQSEAFAKVGMGAAAVAAGAMGPVTVEVVTVNRQNFQSNLLASGTLLAVQGSVLKAEAEGRVIAINANSGQQVTAGQEIVQINPGILSGQLKVNQATLALNQVTYDRYQKLFSEKGIAKEDLDTAKANFLKAQGNLEQTQAAIDKTLIKAPFAGQLGIIKVNLGDYVTVGQTIVSLQNTDSLYVDFPIPEKMIPNVHVAEAISLKNETIRNLTFNGKIIAMDTKLDPATRTLLIRGLVTNSNHQLLPGMFVLVNISVGQPSATIFIPQSAVQYAPDGNFVFKIVNNKAIRVKVILGIRQNDQVEIKNGLEAGDQVVVAGIQKLHDGSEIKIIHP